MVAGTPELRMCVRPLTTVDGEQPSRPNDGIRMPTRDLGVEVIDRIYELLMVDAERSIRGPRGFTWWSYRLAQHVKASVPVFVGDRHVCEVRIWTEIVNGIGPEDPVADVVSLPNTHATLSATVRDPVWRSTPVPNYRLRGSTLITSLYADAPT